jgi:transcriptional regulator with PAS, ATPase and Fis domain
MRESLLKKVQDTIIKHAKVIASVLKVDVEIVDENLIRIAGTGIYKNDINKSISSSGDVYKYVLKSGEQKIITNPRENELCANCKGKKTCNETMEACTPIVFEDKIIGVIGLICFDEEQKINLENNLDSMIQFIQQMKELIVFKISEHLEKEVELNNSNLLKQIIDSVDNGVIVTSHDGKIATLNQNAMKQLKLLPSNIGDAIKIKQTNEFFMGGESITVTVGSEKYDIIGKMIPVYPVLGDYDKILIFNQIQKVKSDLLKMTYGRNTVGMADISGSSKEIKMLKIKIKKIAPSKSTVLVTGESGTGKELIARAIHSESDRWNKPFIAINCGAIPDSLLESELFGYVRGAFSGADPNGRIGKFELANKGVIFLDEIGDMPLFLQVKLLRVLQERKLVRIGSNKLLDLDIRVIAATNKDLKKLIAEGKFREDLYYRLNVIPMELPALKKRPDDIETITKNLIEKYNNIFNKYVHTINPEVIEILKRYSWPGNVRELENVVEFMINLSDERGIITKEMIPEHVLKIENDNYQVNNITINTGFRKLKDIEEENIKRALKYFGEDTKGKKEAAKALGIGVATLYRKIAQN